MRDIISQHHMLIIGVLIIILLLLVAFLILLLRYRRIGSNNEGSRGSSRFVPQETHNKILKERDELRDKCKILESGNTDYYKLQEDYENARVKIGKLKSQIEDLKRNNIELEELFKKSSLGKDNGVLPDRTDIKISSKTETQIILYASFPRSADSRIYFSDLTEGLADDSYFELKVSHETGKASFKPLDFMKIRNYDPAMAAMVTEGVKPNLASTVLGIEPGKAHIEGKDWIIDNPAIIKIA